MIFKLSHLEGIKAGKITLAFRKWKKPMIRNGSRIKTEIVVIGISDVTEVRLRDITAEDAARAGFGHLEDLLAELASIPEGRIYRMKVSYHSEDPRIAMRAQTAVPEDDFQRLKKKLERLDQYKQGAWTLTVLKTIRDNPKLRAADLAEQLHMEKDVLKINIRKLKNLGLTISHEVGYSISPLGEFFLKKISRN